MNDTGAADAFRVSDRIAALGVGARSGSGERTGIHSAKRGGGGVGGGVAGAMNPVATIGSGGVCFGDDGVGGQTDRLGGGVGIAAVGADGEHAIAAVAAVGDGSGDHRGVFE